MQKGFEQRQHLLWLVSGHQYIHSAGMLLYPYPRQGSIKSSNRAHRFIAAKGGSEGARRATGIVMLARVTRVRVGPNLANLQPAAIGPEAVDGHFPRLASVTATNSLRSNVELPNLATMVNASSAASMSCLYVAVMQALASRSCSRQFQRTAKGCHSTQGLRGSRYLKLSQMTAWSQNPSSSRVIEQIDGSQIRGKPCFAAMPCDLPDLVGGRARHRGGGREPTAH